MKNYKILRLEGNRIQQLIGYEYDKKNQLINEWVAGVTAVSRLFGKKALPKVISKTILKSVDDITELLITRGGVPVKIGGKTANWKITAEMIGRMEKVALKGDDYSKFLSLLPKTLNGKPFKSVIKQHLDDLAKVGKTTTKTSTTKKLIRGTLATVGALEILTQTICGKGVFDSLRSILSQTGQKSPNASNDVTSTEKEDLYRFRLRYYSPGYVEKSNFFNIPTKLGDQMPFTGHIGVKPDDEKLNEIIPNANNNKYWTDWGPGLSGAETGGGNMPSHQFTGTFSGCKPNSKDCGRTPEGDYYIYLTKDQVKRYYQQQPQYVGKKHDKWGPFKIEDIGPDSGTIVDIPSIPSFCNSSGYHVGKNNCADAVSNVLGLSSGLKSGGITTPYNVTQAALNAFPNQNA
tara:strand:- start:4383 stop:5594 length:1212 start_codon:yes stop_codon:yes gene_type:complete